MAGNNDKQPHSYNSICNYNNRDSKKNTDINKKEFLTCMK